MFPWPLEKQKHFTNDIINIPKCHNECYKAIINNNTLFKAQFKGYFPSFRLYPHTMYTQVVSMIKTYKSVTLFYKSNQ